MPRFPGARPGLGGLRALLSRERKRGVSEDKSGASSQSVTPRQWYCVACRALLFLKGEHGHPFPLWSGEGQE